MNKCDNKYTTQFHFTLSKNMHISSIPSDNTDTCGGDYRGSRGVILLDVKVISCYNITVVLVVRLIPLPINSKKKCKDAKKSLTARQAGKIDAFTGSIPAIYIRCTTRSQRSNNAKSSPSPHPTPLCHCLPAKE